MPLRQPNSSPSSEYWNGVADIYPNNLSILYRRKKDFDHALMPAGAKGRLLDAGCGKGDDAIYFARHGFGDVHAIDASAAMVQAARDKVAASCSAKEREKITLRQADILSLPYPRGFFDVVCSFSVIDHLPRQIDRDRALRELARVTRPGGSLVLTFPNRNSLPAMLRRNRELIVRPKRANSRDLIEVVVRSRTAGCPEYQYEALYDRADMLKIASMLELSDPRVSSGVMTSLRHIRSLAQLSSTSFLPADTEFLLDEIQDHKLRSKIECTIDNWTSLPISERGVRIGVSGTLRFSV